MFITCKLLVSFKKKTDILVRKASCLSPPQEKNRADISVKHPAKGKFYRILILNPSLLCSPYQ